MSGDSGDSMELVLSHVEVEYSTDTELVRGDKSMDTDLTETDNVQDQTHLREDVTSNVVQVCPHLVLTGTLKFASGLHWRSAF